MKIVDFEHHGNAVKFYLADDDVEEYYGDDWDDIPYECNAGPVYSEFYKATATVYFPFDDLVLEPSNNWREGNSRYCKDDMRNGLVPCIIVVPKVIIDDDWDDTFPYWLGATGTRRFYFGDKMDPGVWYFDVSKELVTLIK